MTTGAATAILAAGTVVVRPGAGGPEVLLVHRPKYDDWSFPKGKLDREEHVVLAAVRETHEETGFTVRLGRPLPTQHYSVSGRAKTVSYWAAEHLGGEFVPNDEVDRVRWLPLPAARTQLTWSRDSRVIDAVAAGPLQTTAVLLLRAGQAVTRGEWTGDDDLRPLDAAGVARSASLSALLGAYSPQRVLCSDTVRALETVRPYADSHGLTIEVTPLLGEAGFAAATDSARAELGALRSTTEGTLLCTHRPVLAALMRTLSPSTRATGPAAALSHGAVRVLHLHQGSIIAVENHTGP